MTPRTRDPEATRAAILDAAEAAILEHGFGRATTSEIAKRAGVTKSLLHHHFGSKEGIWNEVKARRFSSYAERQMAMLRTQEPNPGLLRDSITTYFHFLRENPELVRILVWMYLEPGAESCTERHDELIEAGIAKLLEGQAHGLLRADVNAGLFLFMFLGLVQHWFQDRDFYLRHLGPEKTSAGWDEAFLENLLKVLLEGVLPR